MFFSTLLPGFLLKKVFDVFSSPLWVSLVAQTVKNPSTCCAGDPGSIPGPGRSPGGGNGNPTPVLLPGKSHGRRIWAGYSPWGPKSRTWLTPSLSLLLSSAPTSVSTPGPLSLSGGHSSQTPPFFLRGVSLKGGRGHPHYHATWQDTQWSPLC